MIHAGGEEDPDTIVAEGDDEEEDELPICQSYSDLEESLRATHRMTRLKHTFLAWFYRRFILEPTTAAAAANTTTTGVPSDSLVTSASTSMSSSSGTKSSKTAWSLNYREAAIYLEEGFNNDKFDYHPHLFTKLPAYLAVHNHCYYLADLFGCFLILSLAVFEKPAVDRYHLPELVS